MLALVKLTPTELIVGATGFLANKVDVLLAAFKPLQSNLRVKMDLWTEFLDEIALNILALCKI